MWPEPDDPAVVQRMRAAHHQARKALRVWPVRGGHEAWGWRGRTLGQPVTTTERPAWLRVNSAPLDQIVDTFWNGSIDAQRSIPPSMPRPMLIRWHDWTDQPWAYRAELYERAAARPIAIRAILTTIPDLPKAWWTTLRTTLDDIAAVRTQRITIHKGFLAWAMPQYLGISAGGAPVTWTTAHGDLHYANICGPRLCLLDWEGWGTAPAGYDAATLHSYSLLVPTIAARVREELAQLLDTDSGRFAELAVITEILHNATHGQNLALIEQLRRRAEFLIGHAIPEPPPATS